ncbi:Metallo-dependent hydrolase [Fistulina hepatica ATCC 64428]|uniref:Metallo-dependent hydrolase n=1 Tax=Fistulina hepatica ATCC 64428 TaxID=1128425 RepID=A0A0D7A5C5_9AGAR|nr:Metallo-dependent hydrolase [Fistulina hepatica ATCC 64428]
MLFRGTLVHCPTLGSLDILEDYLLGVDDAGFIMHVDKYTSVSSLELVKNATVPPIIIPFGDFLLPTFVDMHLHAPQFMYQGTGLDLPLMDWLERYAFRAEERIDADPTLAKKVYTRLASRLIEHGTGSVLLFGTLKEETNLILAEVMQSAGIRAFVGKLSMDMSSRPSYVEKSAQDSIDAARSFVSRCRDMGAHLPPHRRLVEPVLTPRFVPTCSEELLSALAELSFQDTVRVQSHLAEAHDQVSWVEQERGMSDIDVFDKHRLLTPRTIQAHCTFLDSLSLQRLEERGTAVAHCPLSNVYFSARPFRLREALDAGVKVGLGSDIAGGYVLDIMQAMRQAVIVSRMRQGAQIMGDTQGTRTDSKSLAIDWKESLYLATRGGALALQLPEGSGTFTVGAPFDCQQIRLFQAGPFGSFEDSVGNLDIFDISPPLITEENIEKWWCLGDVRNRRCVFVQGARVGDFKG